MKRGYRRRASRRHRSRPTPKWLLKAEDIDQVARQRCLMVLSVLSGETPVTDAIKTAGISRGTYYQLETRALSAMLRSLGPTPSLEEVETTLTSLAARSTPLVVCLPRQSGQKEVRYAHLLSGAVTITDPLLVPEPELDRISKLEKELDDLRKQFEEFRRRFE